MIGVIVSVLVAAQPVEGGLEQQALRLVRDRFERVGRTAPARDEALSVAAQALATVAATRGAETATTLLRVAAETSRAGATDPTPTVIMLRGAERVLEPLAKEPLPDEPASHVGIGAATVHGITAVAILFVNRRADVRPFPRHFPKPAPPQKLCVHLDERFSQPELFVTRPDGHVEQTPLPHATEACRDVALPTKGRHTIEVLARGPRGPEVVAIFFVDVGVASTDDESSEAEPSTAKEARERIVLQTNELRRAMKLAPVVSNQPLEAVAQAYAERMAREEFLAHVDGSGADVSHRLAEAKITVRAAGENLGLSSGPLAAHFGIVHSPGHRRTLLVPDYQDVGLGIAQRKDGLTVLVEVFAAPAAPESADPLADAYEAIAKLRKANKLPALKRNVVLEAIALGHAKAALERDVPKTAIPGVKPVHERVFKALPETTAAAVDFVLVQSARSIPASKNLLNGDYQQVGVGYVRGDSATHGKDKAWLVIVFISP